MDAILNVQGLYQGIGADTYGATTASFGISNVPVVEFTTASANVVPEPGTLTLVLGGGSLFTRRIRRRK